MKSFFVVTPVVALALAATSTATVSDQCSSKSAKSAAWHAPKDIVDTALEAGSFKTLTTALTKAGLVEALKGDGPFTVFAPTDEAFAKIPKETLADLLRPENRGTLQSILTYHVVAGDVRAADVVKLNFASTLNGQRVDIVVDEGTVMIDGATVQTTDIVCKNGVIHVIDSVILPNTNDVVETAVENGNFKTLAAALEAANLVATLQGEGPFTVFAPTDAAFAALPKGTVENLLKPENREKLTAILKYHVVSGRVYAKDAIAAGRAATLQGSEIKARIADGKLMIGDAKVAATDIETSNGVIHVIDKVLIP